MSGSADTSSAAACEAAAVRLLARREHARAELAAKLRQRDFDGEIVSEVLSDLEGRGLLSDERFAEEYVRYRYNRGYGPLRIRAELRERGVDDGISDRWLDDPELDWAAAARAARRKRFGDAGPESLPERQREQRFLNYRGFTGDQIRAALDDAS
ncbi:regulatory protein RecX [Ectothiorhodospiraceae bacterium WFHF3C12]|nr:regulatory protein RecX [Ectothiorhodospiraceae bacterium WFHF3C12]